MIVRKSLVLNIERNIYQIFYFAQYIRTNHPYIKKVLSKHLDTGTNKHYICKFSQYITYIGLLQDVSVNILSGRLRQLQFAQVYQN